MYNCIECQSLFAFNSILMQKVFSQYKFPWEILPHLNDIISELIREGIEGYRKGTDNILIGRDVKIDDTAKIEGPAIIGNGCDVRHGAYIRGSVLLGDGCVIGNSTELKNSVLMDGVQAPHYNYVGDSILGEGAHLGAGAICSNLRSDKSNVSIKVLGTEILTGLRKLGAILGDHTEIGCGAVLCPGTIVGKETTIYPLTMARGCYQENSIVKKDGSVIQRDK